MRVTRTGFGAVVVALAGWASAARGEVPPLEDLFELRARDPDQVQAPPPALLTPDCLASRESENTALEVLVGC